MSGMNGYLVGNGIQLPELERKEEFTRLAGNIDLNKEESYDCSSMEVWSYRKGGDVRDGINLRLGNMCNGFPFTMARVRFHNSECAYIAGAYAGNDAESIRIQELIAGETNGQKCKRLYRMRPEFIRFMRDDFYEYNVQWMMFVIWQKCLHNNDFASLLRQLPVGAHIVENTSLHKGPTALFWGAKNPELMKVRSAAEGKVAAGQSFRYKKELRYAQMIAGNRINNTGIFSGRNVMGKIIKLCSLALIFGEEPPINYPLLAGEKLYLAGHLIELQIFSKH